MGKEDDRVDAETKLEILQMKDSIVEAVTKLFTESNLHLEKTLREHYDLRLDHLEKEQERSFKHHIEHFEAIKNLQERQTKDEGKEEGKEKTNAFLDNKKTIFWTIAGVIITILIFLLSP